MCLTTRILSSLSQFLQILEKPFFILSGRRIFIVSGIFSYLGSAWQQSINKLERDLRSVRAVAESSVTNTFYQDKPLLLVSFGGRHVDPPADRQAATSGSLQLPTNIKDTSPQPSIPFFSPSQPASQSRTE
jgi:hypothetical protein